MIKDTINRINSELPATVKLVAVSKFHPSSAIIEAYEAGQRAFAESRPQELALKVAELGPEYQDIEWHFIGHLQTNKLKMVLPYASLVQSVDSIRLLSAIDDWGRRNNKVIPILIECHISSDESKQGFSEQEFLDLLSSEVRYEFVTIRGVMGMATYTDDLEIVRSDFQRLKDRSMQMSERRGVSVNLPSDVSCSEVSMGMSGDYPLAVEMGSTIIRIGSMIFGERI